MRNLRVTFTFLSGEKCESKWWLEMNKVVEDVDARLEIVEIRRSGVSTRDMRHFSGLV